MLFFESWPKILLLKLANQDHFSVIRQNYLNVVPISTRFILEFRCRLPDDSNTARWNMEFWEQYLKNLRRRHTVLRIAFKFSLHDKYCLKYLYLYFAKQKITGLIYKRVGCKVLLLFWFLCLDVNNNVNKGFYLKSELGDAVFELSIL